MGSRHRPRGTGRRRPLRGVVCLMPTTELRASYDARVSEATANTNFGEERFLAVRTGSGTNQYNYVAWAGLPEVGSTIVSSATVRVWLKGTAWTGTNDIIVRRVVEGWKEAQVTWNNKADVDTGVFASNSVTNGTDGQSVDIDVTAIMAAVMTGSAWFGFRVQTSTGAAARNLYSSEATDPALRPLLII